MNLRLNIKVNKIEKSTLTNYIEASVYWFEFRKSNSYFYFRVGDIAQFGRASEWHSEGQEFEPPYLHK